MKEKLLKAVSWVLINVLWPILADILVHAFRALLKSAFAGVKAMVRKWQDAEVAKADTPEQQAEIREKYAAHLADIEELDEKLQGTAEKVVADALTQGEALRTRLLAQPLALEAPKSAEPQGR